MHISTHILLGWYNLTSAYKSLLYKIVAVEPLINNVKNNCPRFEPCKTPDEDVHSVDL